jgi:phage portal protein BeeE
MIISRMRRRSVNASLGKMIIEYLSGGTYTNSGVAINSETAMQQATVYACVKVLFTIHAQMPLHLMRSHWSRKGYDH